MKRFRNSDVESERAKPDCVLVSSINEEKKTIIWRIENIQRALLKRGEFFESPAFRILEWAGKWTLKLYPFYATENSARDGYIYSNTVGLYINPLSENPKPSFFKCRFSYKRELQNDSSEQVRTFPFPIEGDIELRVDTSQPETCGTNNLFDSVSLEHPQTLLIKCDICVANISSKRSLSDESSYSKPNINRHKGFSNYDTLKTHLYNIYRNSKYHDIILKAKDRQFPAHKAILAGRSSTFRSMFYDMEEKEIKTGVIEIEDIEPETLDKVLLYIYSGRVDELNVEKAILLCPIASKYDLDELKEWCVKVILDNLSIGIICKVAVLLDLDPDPDPKLKKAILDMFRNYTGDIFKRKEWHDLVQGSNHQGLVSKILETVSVEISTNFV